MAKPEIPRSSAEHSVSKSRALVPNRDEGSTRESPEDFWKNLTPEVRNVFYEKALAYAQEKNLPIDGEDQLGNVVRVIVAAFFEGLADQKLPKKISRTFIVQTLREGLRKRKDFFSQAARTLHELHVDFQENRGEKRLPHALADHLAIDRAEIETATREYQRRSRLTSLPHLQDIVRVTDVRKGLLQHMSLQLAVSMLSIDVHDPQLLSKLQSKLEKPQAQAKLLRGLIAVALLISNGAKGKLNPMFIEEENIAQLIDILPDIEDDEEYIQKLTESLVRTLQVSEYNRSDAQEFLKALLDQLILRVKNWQMSRTYIEEQKKERENESERSLAYWTTFGEYFSSLVPLDQLTLREKFGFTLEGIRFARSAGASHLWEHGVTLNGKLIPSIRDILLGKEIVFPNRYEGENRTLWRSLREAESAWRHYALVRTEYPDRIKEYQGRVDQITERIGNKDLPLDASYKYSTARYQLTNYRKKIAQFQKDAEVDEVLQSLHQVDEQAPLSEKAHVFLQGYQLIRTEETERLVGRFGRYRKVLNSSLSRPTVLEALDMFAEREYVAPIEAEGLSKDLEKYLDLLAELEASTFSYMPKEYFAHFSKSPEVWIEFFRWLEKERNSPNMKTKLRKIAQELSKMPAIPLTHSGIRRLFVDSLTHRIQTIRKLLSLLPQWEFQSEQLALLKRVNQYQDDQKAMMKIFGGDEVAAEREYRILQLSMLPREMRTEGYRMQFLATKKIVDDYFFKFYGRYTFLIPPLSKLPRMIEQQKRAKGNYQRRNEFFDRVGETLHNPFFPWQEAEGLDFLQFMKAVRQRMHTYQGVTEKGRLERQMAQLEGVMGAYSPEHIQLNSQRAYLRNKVRGMESQIATADSDLLTAMMRYGFAIDPKEVEERNIHTVDQ